jgi:chemotaxis protein methyltransferase CheR
MQLESTDLKAFLATVYQHYGYDFTGYAESSVKRRIIHFMEQQRIHSLESLEKMILADDAFCEAFIQSISVTVTEMFRDPLFYKALREKVMKRLATYPVIKIWIAGCATGEEVYSIAILLKEEGLLSRAVIYATDINQQSLKVAKEGIYNIAHMKTYTANYLRSGGQASFSEYYKAKYESVIFDRSLRKNIVFSMHNLSADSSFNEFQLIICRNVLIYFNAALQDKVISLFHESLCNFGFLALGNKESLLFSSRKADFEETDKSEKIFMKTTS